MFLSKEPLTPMSVCYTCSELAETSKVPQTPACHLLNSSILQIEYGARLHVQIDILYRDEFTHQCNLDNSFAKDDIKCK